MRASTASHCQKRTSNRRLGGGGIEREIKAKFYFHLKKIFFLSTDTDVGGSKQKRVLLSKTCYQTCTRMYRFDNRFKKPHNFTIVHGWKYSKMYFRVHFWVTSFSVEKLAFAQHPLTSCQYTGLTFRRTCVQALYSGRTTLDRGFLLQSLSGILPSLVLFVPHRRP